MNSLFKLYVLHFIFLIYTAGIFGQFQNVTISSAYYPDEVTITINPKNPSQIVAGSNILYFQNDTSLSGYYYSMNAGSNWTMGVLHSTTARPSGDPVILADTNGIFYYLQNSNYAVNPAWDRLLIMKSTDGGMSWNNGTVIGTDTSTVQDKPWGCVDFTHGPHGNNIYVTWTRFSEYIYPGPLDSSIIMFSKSTDGAETWSSAVRISQLSGDAKDSSNSMEGAVPCTGPNGEIYVSWAGPKIRNQQYGIFFDRSTDGGQTWLNEDVYVADQPHGWYVLIPGIFRCNGFPVTCCDNSGGPYRGNIYINWSDNRSGMYDVDVWLSKSTDGGSTWSAAKRVNNDPPGKNQFYNWMTIDQVTGYIYIVFYDQRSTTTYAANVYVAQSTDGGETFVNVRVNTNPVALFYAMFDYIGISAYNGKVRPIWMGSSGSTQTIVTAIIDSFYNIGIKKIGSEIPNKYTLEQNFPNPFNPVTTIRFSIPAAEDNIINLSVFDVTGREIEVILNESLLPGIYEIKWEGKNYSSGIYYYKLTANGFSKTGKMIFLK